MGFQSIPRAVLLHFALSEYFRAFMVVSSYVDLAGTHHITIKCICVELFAMCSSTVYYGCTM